MEHTLGKGRYLKWRIITGITPLIKVSGVARLVQNYGENLNWWLLPAGIGSGFDIGYISLSFRYNYLLNSFFENAPTGGFSSMNIRLGMIF